MILRVLALGAWLWLLIQLFPAQDFGWLSSALAVCAVCSLLAQAGIPFLFFADRHSPRPTDRRWREALGAILGLTPLLALLGFSLIPSSASHLPVVAIYLFIFCEVLFSAFVQTVAFKGHAAGHLRMATALPALLAIARLAAAGGLFIQPLHLVRTESSLLPVYLTLHAVLMTLAALSAFLYARVRISIPLLPRPPSVLCVRETWRYAVMGGAALTTSELDKPLSAHALGLTASGHYSLAYRMCSMLATPATAFAASLLPRWAGMNAKREIAQLMGSFWQALAIVALAGASLSLTLQAFAGGLAEHLKLGLYPEVWPWIYSLAWLIPLLGAHQITSAGLLAIGRPLSRAGIDLFAFALLAGIFALLLPYTGKWALPLSCIAAELVATISGALTFTLAHRRQA